MPVRVVPAHGVGGGMERVAWSTARGLARRGHDVRVVTTAHPLGAAATQEDGVRVHHVTGSTWRRYDRRWWDACFALLADEHRHTRYDVVLSQSAGALGYVREASAGLGLPVVVVLHGSAAAELRTAWRGARTARGVYRLARLGWRLPRELRRWRAVRPHVRGWLAVSDAVARANGRAVGVASSRIRSLPVGVDTTRFRPDPAAGQEARRRLGIPPGAPVAIVVSRLEREKGVQVALDAVAALAPRHPDLHLLVAGTGHHEAALRRRAARLGLNAPGRPACRFLGLVGHDALPSVLAGADVFLLPSLCEEGRPVSLVEASAVGLPVVATASAGTAGTVVDGVTGLLVPRRDPAALATALARLLADGAARRAMGDRGRQEAVRRGSEAAMLDVVEQALVDAVTERTVT